MKILKLLLWIGLFVVAKVFSIILVPIAMLYSIIKLLVYGRIGELTDYFKRGAIGIDQLGNVLIGSHLLNDTLVSKNPYHFGSPDETVSGVIGKNKRSGTLSELGKNIAHNLNEIEKDHVEKAIEDDETNKNINSEN